MGWLKDEWPRLVVTGLLEAVIGLVALAVIHETVSNPDVRDIGIVAVWVAVILGGTAVLIVSPWRRPVKSDKPLAVPPSPVTSESQEAEPSPRFAFDPYRFMFSKIMRVDCTGLWAEHDHYIDFIVYVKQTSDWEVALTDVRGRMRIGVNECNLPAHLVNSPRKLIDPRGFYDCTIRQPLTQEMAVELARNPGSLNLWDENARVNFSLAGLKWIGTVALPQGTTALPDRVVCEEAFSILGPVREGDDDKVLIRHGTFLSSQVWRHHDSGLLRSPDVE